MVHAYNTSYWRGRDQPRLIVLETLSLASGVAQLVGHLRSEYEVWVQTPMMHKKIKTRNQDTTQKRTGRVAQVVEHLCVRPWVQIPVLPKNK
jgi:hypothetical protein